MCSSDLALIAAIYQLLDINFDLNILKGLNVLIYIFYKYNITHQFHHKPCIVPFATNYW